MGSNKDTENRTRRTKDIQKNKMTPNKTFLELSILSWIDMVYMGWHERATSNGTRAKWWKKDVKSR